MSWYQRCVALEPNYPDVHTNMAAIFKMEARYIEAAAALRSALRIQPADALSTVNLAFLEQSQLQWRGRRAMKRQIVGIIKEALAAPPEGGEDFPVTAIDLAFTVCESPRLALAAAQVEARYVTQIAAKVMRHRDWAVSLKGAPFKVGYISSDLRNHAVGIALRGVLKHHGMKVVLFRLEETPKGDPFWAEYAGLEHVTSSPVLQEMELPEAVNTVERSGVHILINLNGNTEGSRNEITAGVRVPCQLHFLGSPASLGLPSVPYITGDPVSLPPHLALSSYSERVVMLPWSHHPADREGYRDIAPPETENIDQTVPGSPFTFGSLNRLVKLDPATLSTWTQTAIRVPGSRLCVVAPPEALQGLNQEVSARGLASLDALGRRDRKDHIARIRRGIDLSLETTLVGGGSTVLDALWAAVPIMMTTEGNTMGSRFATTASFAMGISPDSTKNLKQLEDAAVALAGLK